MHRCARQVVANILGQGSELRELARDVEDKLRQVELESIQVSRQIPQPRTTTASLEAHQLLHHPGGVWRCSQ